MRAAIKKVAIALPVGYTIGWMAYYAYTDTTRRRILAKRQEKYQTTLDSLAKGNQSEVASAAEIEAIKQRYASLWIAGRLWNVTPEWREQGAWEWALWKLLISTVTLKLFYNGGVPEERPIPDLPIERPDFHLLFGSPSSTSGPVDPLKSDAFPPSQSFASTIPKVHASPLAPLVADGGDRMGDSWVDIKRESAGSATPTPARPSPPLSTNSSEVEVTDKLTITWIGQSTSFVTMDGLCVLTDPIFSDQTLPSIVAPYRLRPPPCRLDELKKVDVVLVSHNHFDHLDPLAIQELGDSVQWLVPLGVGKFIREHGVTRVTEMDWWQEEEYTLKHPRKPDQSFKITALPLMHWSARSPLDTNATLWAAFHIKSASPKGTSFLHLGDTGYSPSLFSAIGRVIGPVDLAAVPIGSYEPRWHMHLQHTDPEGAVRMAQDMSIRKSIPVHWGTWLMSDESYNKPPIDLAIARQKLGFAEERFCTVPVGKTVVVE